MSESTKKKPERDESSKPPAPPKRSVIHRKWFVVTIFLLPFVLLFVVFRVYAIGHAVVMSFQDIQGVGGQSEWIGLGNYLQLATDSTFYLALRNTAAYVAGTLAVLIPFPFVLAALLHTGLVRRTTMFRTAIFLPVLTSLVVVGVIFSLLLSTNGLLNQVLATFGFEPQAWLQTQHLAVPALVIMATWRWTGLNVIYFTTGLSNIDNDLYESAAVDGAGIFRRFWYLSVPLSKPIILFVTVLTLFNGFQLFVEPFIIWGTGAGPGQGGLSIVMLLYREAFTSFRLGYASSIGVVLAAIIMMVSIVQLKLFGFFKKDED
ncbi:sugar ABC transporter permease [Egibacter rhizosphaerae]|uniref:Sugar ABC transporter permease n=1 Tax=Egibacter rhizosphaerae TaxID=1670831 RepID=A0A411YAY6_9ACTN|nr:sugar ABC transporter permease [Egibacter rhizosphaerae]QBI18355.1 sugar ABC transporter permease [Egibacter rhizosphaerae]